MAIDISTLLTPEQMIRLIDVDPRLKELDPEGETFASFRQATRGDMEALGELTARATREWNDQEVGVVKLTQDINYAVIEREQVRLTMTECNIEKDGKPLFPTREINGRKSMALDPNQFAKRWGELPVQLATALLGACYKANPQWGTAGEE